MKKTIAAITACLLAATLGSQTRTPTYVAAAGGVINAKGFNTKLPRVNVTYPDFGAPSGCANTADPTGSNDSTCAIQAAITWAENNPQGGNYPVVYFPPGTYKITSNLSDNGGIQYSADGASLRNL